MINPKVEWEQGLEEHLELSLCSSASMMTTVTVPGAVPLVDGWEVSFPSTRGLYHSFALQEVHLNSLLLLSADQCVMPSVPLSSPPLPLLTEHHQFLEQSVVCDVLFPISPSLEIHHGLGVAPDLCSHSSSISRAFDLLRFYGSCDFYETPFA